MDTLPYQLYTDLLSQIKLIGFLVGRRYVSYYCFYLPVSAVCNENKTIQRGKAIKKKQTKIDIRDPNH